jgi:hypothetical protein
MEHSTSMADLARLAKLERTVTVSTAFSSAMALLITIGQLTFYTQPRDFTAHHLNALQASTGIIGIMILMSLLATLAAHWQSTKIRHQLQNRLGSMSQRAQMQHKELMTLQAKAECIASELLSISHNCDGIEAHIRGMLKSESVAR